MKAIELSKAYDPKSFEDRIYEAWKTKGLFRPASVPGKKPFVVVIPPPNVTGVLHMGHGLNNSLQDILVRYHRMRGEPTLWVPGTDHAGIATQHVVEKRLRAAGVDRRDLGREKFVEETWKVKAEHHAVITKQLEKIGASCDWSRERFTLDEGLSRAVREVFVTLYERGLVYRGKYLVNWCPSCGTALSDDEVEHEDEGGAMYHIRYPLVEGPAPGAPEGYIEIATTRPETLLGDTAVAAHPDDERYRELVGRKLALPLAGRTIPIIADAYVDREFGTGLVKITPAHDPNDFEVGRRHGLPQINVLSPDGTMGGAAPEKYRGMKVEEARRAVVEDLRAMGLFVAEKPITHSIGHCYRCHNVVEPYLSEQWFVKMKPLADKALKAWRDGEVRFFRSDGRTPTSTGSTNIRDWCISRQLWWGHRIPAWRCAHCGKIVVAREDPTECPFCKSTELVQDEDVLDTWFSSWLWPFSTLGWPKDTADLRKYYPTSALVTGYDIIFFWVARMIMAGMEFMERSPFRDVCITTLVRDKQGRKMSKSLGNGIDPLEIVDEHGADALKFTLAFLFTPSQDILIDKDDFKLGSKFANKVWNASRYILMNLEGRSPVAEPARADMDRWILHRLNSAAAAVRTRSRASVSTMPRRRSTSTSGTISATGTSRRRSSRSRSGDEAEKDRAMAVLVSTLAESLRLLHPFIPFVTEEIFQKLPRAGGSSEGGSWLIKGALSRAVARTGAIPLSPPRFESLRELVRLEDAAIRIPDSARGQDAPRSALRAGLRGLRFPRGKAALVGLLVKRSGARVT